MLMNFGAKFPKNRNSERNSNDDFGANSRLIQSLEVSKEVLGVRLLHFSKICIKIIGFFWGGRKVKIKSRQCYEKLWIHSSLFCQNQLPLYIQSQLLHLYLFSKMLRKKVPPFKKSLKIFLYSIRKRNLITWPISCNTRMNKFPCSLRITLVRMKLFQKIINELIYVFLLKVFLTPKLNGKIKKSLKLFQSPDTDRQIIFSFKAGAITFQSDKLNTTVHNIIFRKRSWRKQSFKQS